MAKIADIVPVLPNAPSVSFPIPYLPVEHASAIVLLVLPLKQDVMPTALADTTTTRLQIPV